MCCITVELFGPCTTRWSQSLIICKFIIAHCFIDEYLLNTDFQIANDGVLNIGFGFICFCVHVVKSFIKNGMHPLWTSNYIQSKVSGCRSMSYYDNKVGSLSQIYTCYFLFQGTNLLKTSTCPICHSMVKTKLLQISKCPLILHP